jgi:hypothetical protein
VIQQVADQDRSKRKTKQQQKKNQREFEKESASEKSNMWEDIPAEEVEPIEEEEEQTVQKPATKRGRKPMLNHQFEDAKTRRLELNR